MVNSQLTNEEDNMQITRLEARPISCRWWVGSNVVLLVDRGFYAQNLILRQQIFCVMDPLSDLRTERVVQQGTNIFLYTLRMTDNR